MNGTEIIQIAGERFRVLQRFIATGTDTSNREYRFTIERVERVRAEEADS